MKAEIAKMILELETHNLYNVTRWVGVITDKVTEDTSLNAVVDVPDLKPGKIALRSDTGTVFIDRSDAGALVLISDSNTLEAIIKTGPDSYTVVFTDSNTPAANVVGTMYMAAKINAFFGVPTKIISDTFIEANN